MKRLLIAAGAAAAAVAGLSTSAPAASQPPRLAFERGTRTSSVWVAGADGTGPRKLGDGSDPLIAPTGSYVAAARLASTGAALLVYPTGSGTAHGFFDIAKVQAIPLAWSPDGRYLAVELSDTAARGIGSSGLAVVDTSTMTARTIARGIVYGASFDPAGSGRIVYGLARAQRFTARVDLHTIAAVGTGPRRLTRDGRSLYPVWARSGIFFDRERLRGTQDAPVYQVALRHGSRTTQLTHMRIPSLVEGLVPVAASADGNRLLAEYSGQDTSYAWTLQLRPRRIREVRVGRRLVQGASISHDGRTLLIDEGAFENPASAGRIETVPFGGGPARRLTRGGSPSWTL